MIKKNRMPKTSLGGQLGWKLIPVFDSEITSIRNSSLDKEILDEDFPMRDEMFSSMNEHIFLAFSLYCVRKQLISSFAIHH